MEHTMQLIRERQTSLSKTVTEGFNPQFWIDRFERNKSMRPEPDWAAPITLAPTVIARLRDSLEQFQLGDGGGPAFLIAGNRENFLAQSDEIRRLVVLWFDEEKEHSRLLGGLVARFKGTPITRHWSFSVFCACRRFFGVHFELTVLLLTEISSTAYYRTLRRYTDDRAVRDVCKLILRDEAGHIQFHCARLAAERRTFGYFWAITFRVLGACAATMLWVNHAAALRAVGGSRRGFYRELSVELSRFIRRVRISSRDRASITDNRKNVWSSNTAEHGI